MNSIDDRSVTVDPLGTGTIATTAGAGAPIHLPVSEGPITVTGVPTLKGTVASAALALPPRAISTAPVRIGLRTQGGTTHT